MAEQNSAHESMIAQAIALAMKYQAAFDIANFSICPEDEQKVTLTLKLVDRSLHKSEDSAHGIPD